jgi:hypothetical protein
MVRPDHLELPEGTTLLDLAKAEAMFRAWRRGKLSLPILRYRLVADCGIPPHMVEEGITSFGALPMSEIEKMEAEDEAALREMGGVARPIIFEG